LNQQLSVDKIEAAEPIKSVKIVPVEKDDKSLHNIKPPSINAINESKISEKVIGT
jgi:hypothetical protein